MRNGLYVCVLAAACAGAPSGSPSVLPPAVVEPAASPGSSTIFYAVLEGLYDEGVGNDDVDILLRADKATQRLVHFVPGCPLCLPTIDALRLYRLRPKFYGLKGEPDSFGDGLPERERTLLRGSDDEQRQVLQAFVERSLQRRMASLRLTAAERTQWELVLHEMREKGTMLLRAAQSHDASVLGGAKGCAACDGLHAAGAWMAR